jgi:hypothetical protein
MIHDKPHATGLVLSTRFVLDSPAHLQQGAVVDHLQQTRIASLTQEHLVTLATNGPGGLQASVPQCEVVKLA